MADQGRRLDPGGAPTAPTGYGAGDPGGGVGSAISQLLQEVWEALDTDNMWSLDWSDTLQQLPATNVYRQLGEKYLGIK